MPEFLERYIEALGTGWRVADVLDIAIIAVFIYFGFVWLRRRASRSILVALGLIAGLFILSRQLNMFLTLQLTQVGISVVVLGLILIFQEDIRQAFERLSSWNFFQRQTDVKSSFRFIDTLVHALSEFVDHKVGSLIVIQGRESLDRHIRGGIPVNGELSTPLLCSLFDPHSPGHDGAVIIENGRLEKFGVYLPLSRNLEEVGEGGTRHTAGLGLSERSDALVIIVSEERGTICVAQRGKMEYIESLPKIQQRLQEFVQQLFPTPRRVRWYQWFTHNLGAKLSALAIAFALWLVFGIRVGTVQRTYSVPIEYRNLPPNMALEEEKPIEARVTLSGSERNFNLLDPNTLVISLDVSKIRPGAQEIAVTGDNLNNPPELLIEQLEPQVIRLNVYRLRTVEVPVRVQTEGRLREPLELVRMVVTPPRVRIQVRHDVGGPDLQVQTEPIDLSTVLRSTTIESKLILPEGTRFTEPEEATVSITLEVAAQRGSRENPAPQERREQSATSMLDSLEPWRGDTISTQELVQPSAANNSRKNAIAR